MNEKINIIKLWIEKADHDLGTAQITYLHIPKFKDTIAFHCQQAVEKYLKSYLIFLDIAFNKTHNLTLLLSQVSQKDKISNELFDKVAQLEDFAVEIRYPDTIINLSNYDIEQAINIAKDFRQYILNKMKIRIDYEEVN